MLFCYCPSFVCMCQVNLKFSPFWVSRHNSILRNTSRWFQEFDVVKRPNYLPCLPKTHQEVFRYKIMPVFLSLHAIPIVCLGYRRAGKMCMTASPTTFMRITRIRHAAGFPRTDIQTLQKREFYGIHMNQLPHT